MAPFFTKKQKALMRQRKKRKRGVEEEAKPANDGEAAATNDESKRQKRSEEEAPPTENGGDKKGDSMPDLEFKAKPNGKIVVTVPASLSVKEAKKFRKDARRELRSRGKLSNDDDNVEFVSSEPVPTDETSKPKKSKKFPSIRELMEEKRELDKVKADEEKIVKEREKIQNSIPESLRSRYIAMDCEMVGIGTDGSTSALARVSLVDWHLNTVLDTFVQVPTRVTDFRTFVSGVTAKHIKGKNAMDVSECRNLVSSLLKDKILVGHALVNDLKALMLKHPKQEIRDTAKYRPFQRYGNGKWRPRKLRDLVRENLKDKADFQIASHDSVDDAKATMELFQLVQSQWEKDIETKMKKKSKK